MNYCYIQNGGGGTSRCGVLDLWTGLQINNQELYTATAYWLLLLPVVIQRNGQPLPTPAPAVAYAPKFDKPILTSRIVALNPVSFNSKYLADYGMLRWSMVCEV